MPEPKLRPAKKSDITSLVGIPANESFRGIVADKDGEILAIAGVLHTCPLQAFSIMTEGMRDHPKTILKAIKEFRKILSVYDTTIYALASKTEKNAPRVLEKAGFTHVKYEVYKWQSRQD